MIVRPATRDDAPALAAAHASAFDAPWTGAEILRFAGDPGGFIRVAEAPDGGVAGFILCRLIAGEAEVLTLAVRPGDRRQGVARALLTAALAMAAAVGAPTFLEVAADNQGALALYRQAGFEPVGRRAGYYARPSAGPVDAVVMRRTLNS